MKIYRVWYQKGKLNYQTIYGNRLTAISYADGISNNEDIYFVSVREFECDNDGVFEDKDIVYEYGEFNGNVTEWGWVL